MDTSRLSLLWQSGESPVFAESTESFRPVCDSGEVAFDKNEKMAALGCWGWAGGWGESGTVLILRPPVVAGGAFQTAACGVAFCALIGCEWKTTPHAVPQELQLGVCLEFVHSRTPVSWQRRIVGDRSPRALPRILPPGPRNCCIGNSTFVICISSSLEVRCLKAT